MDVLAENFQDGTFVVADTLPEGAGADSVFVTHKAGFFVAGPLHDRHREGRRRPAGLRHRAAGRRPTARRPPPASRRRYLAINGKTKTRMRRSRSGPTSCSAEGQTFRLQGGGNAVPSIKGADKVVLEGGYPAHAQTFLDMRDIGFEDYATEARRARASRPTSAT